MEIEKLIRNMKKVSHVRLSFKKTIKANNPVPAKPLDDDFFQNKKVVIMGEFFPMNNTTLNENLLTRGASIQPKLTGETEILICGKYPDWMLVEQAKLNGVKVIFVDRAGELFSVILSRMNEVGSFYDYEEPLGV